MVGDGVKRYHHETDGMGTLVGGCHAEIVNTEHPIKAKVIYASQTLEVINYYLKNNKKLSNINFLIDSFRIKSR